MAEDEKPDRAERRRQEKEDAKQKIKAECSDCEKGPCDIAPRTFKECPVCGCPTSFTIEAIKGDLPLKDIEGLMANPGKKPALFSFEYLYDTPNYSVKLVAVGASCARCGVFYTLARDKLRASPLILPR